MRKETIFQLAASAAQDCNLRIHLLGTLQIICNGEPLHLPRRKVEALLAFLLLHPEAHSRDSLATLFWGDTSDEKARHSLRTGLATLRQHLGDDLLIANREQVQINPNFPIGVDLHELLNFGREPDLRQGSMLQSLLDLWRGELLEGFYEDWLTVDREHYHTRLLKIFLKVTHTLRSQSEYGWAIQVAERILQADRANEAAHQHLMFCYVAAGDRAAAQRQYELCEQALLDELDTPPLAETTALYHWIRQQETSDTSITAKITNLPLPLTSFVGRTEQTSEVKRLLNPEGTRTSLLTLTGAGGSGKTRLAIQCATDLLDSFTDGVWWVDLAVLTENAQVAQAIAKSLGVSEARNQTTLQSIINFLTDKQLLLVLDNCEHLISTAAVLADELLGHCPKLQILATSRESLNLLGEVLWQVPTLSLPEPEQLSPLDVLLQHECIRLFYDRALAVQPHFQLTLANAPAVMEICIRLDGIPLAIELAAARVKVLTVEQIAERLRNTIGARFDLLNHGSRAVQPRQQTLRAAIDWSYELLDAEERQLFRTLSIFRGGFTLEALERILESGMQNAESPIHNSQFTIHNSLDLLSQLVDKSLVIVEPQGDRNRYRMLETLREYALEQFTDHKELRRVQSQHAHYFHQFACQVEPQLVRAEQYMWLNRLEIELANLRAALDFLIQEQSTTLALQMTTALYRFWDYRGYVNEGREWLHRALALSITVSDELHAAHTQVAASWLAFRQGDFGNALELLNQAMARFERMKEALGWVDALLILSAIEKDQGNYVMGQKHLEQGLAMAYSSHYDLGIARGLKFMGGVAWDEDRFLEARTHYQESLWLYQKFGDRVSIANLHLNLGDVERMLDNLESAQRNYEQCLAEAQLLGHRGLIGAATKSLGMLAYKQQNYIEAHRLGEEALRIFRSLGDKAHIGFALSNLADVARKAGRMQQALSYFCQTLEIMHQIGYKWPIFYAMEDVASLLNEVRQFPQLAVRLLGAANTLREETNIPVPANQETEYAALVNDLSQQIGEEAFDTLWEIGKTTPLGQQIAEISQLQLS